MPDAFHKAEVLSEKTQIMKIRRAYLVFILMIFLSSCLKEDELKKPFATFKPVELNDSWGISTPETEGMDSLAMAVIFREVHENEDTWMLRSLTVFRHGKLIAESYMKDDADRTKPAAVWSCTKQVLGVLTGIAMEQGIITSVNDKLGIYLPSEIADHPDKADITIEDLLTMRSGISYSNDGVSGQTSKMLRQLPDNSVEFILDLPMDQNPGTVFHYSDGNPHLLSAIYQKKLGRPTDEWADEVLFSRLDFRNYSWHRYRDGITHGAYGILTTPREMAKVAQCVMDHGKWKGQQLVDSAWIVKMVTPYIPDAWNYDGGVLTFGYLWWMDAKRGMMFMNGHGGQYAFAIPQYHLLIVMTSEPNTQGDHQLLYEQAFDIVDKMVGAIMDK